MLILQLPDGLEPLLSTGNSKDIPSLYRRYLSTITHVNSWYEDDVFNPETKGYKSIRQVRGMHRRMQSMMNDKFNVRDLNGRPRVWFNQYDVAMTQFAFIGLAMLYPKKSALIGASNEDLEHINYYWRVLGHLMGIEDDFNACQFDKYEDIHEFMRLIFEHEYKDQFKQHPCQKGLEMTQSICTALHYYMPLLTFNNLARWWSDCFSFNGYELQPMSAKEKVLDLWTRVSFNHLLKYQGFMAFSNKLHRRKFAQRLQNKDKIYEKLKEQYKDNTKLTYHSDRVDYFDSEPVRNLAAVALNLEDDDNNNNTSEPIPSKQAACPLGFGLVKQINGEEQAKVMAVA